MWFRTTVLAGVMSAAPAAVTAQHAHPQQHALRVPESLRAEHAEVHRGLEAAAKANDATGVAARALEAVLAPHFKREEEIALPPLGLLEPLAAGHYRADMAAVLPLTDALKRELPKMLEEHVAIRAAAQRLERVAREHGNADAVALAVKLQEHALAEEQIHYPAAILVGEVVRMRAQR